MRRSRTEALLANPGAAGFVFKRPDWRNPAAYSALQSAAVGKDSHRSLGRFAWEFLRRNEKYQTDWMMFTAAAGGDEGRMTSDAGSEERQDNLDVLEVSYGRRWGIEWMTDPNSDCCPRFIDKGGVVRAPSSGSLQALELESSKLPGNVHGHPALGLRNTRWLVLQIDLTLPADVIDAGVSWLVRHEKRLRRQSGVLPQRDGRPRPDKYVEYLRILDAKAEGASVQDIGAVLRPGDVNDATAQRDKGIRAALNAAREMRDGGYRTLPLHQKFARER